MSKKRPKVPGIFKKMKAMATEHTEPGGVYFMPVYHDDDCPTLETQRADECTCAVIVGKPERMV